MNPVKYFLELDSMSILLHVAGYIIAYAIMSLVFPGHAFAATLVLFSIEIIMIFWSHKSNNAQ